MSKYVSDCENCKYYDDGLCDLWTKEITKNEADDCCDYELSVNWVLEQKIRSNNSLKRKNKSLETKLKEMTYNYQGSMSDCDHYEDVIKKLEAELALSEKKLGVAVDFIEAVHDYDQEFISDYCLEKIKEIEGME